MIPIWKIVLGALVLFLLSFPFMPAAPGDGVLWLLSLFLVLVFSAIVFPKNFFLLSRMRKQGMVESKPEYWKTGVGFSLFFASMLLMVGYQTIFPPAKYFGALVMVFAYAYFADAFESMVERKPSLLFAQVSLITVLVAWLASALVAENVFEGLYLGAKIAYVIVGCAALAQVYFRFAEKIEILPSAGHRMPLVWALALSVAAGLVFLAEAAFSDFLGILVLLRSAALIASMILFYRSFEEFERTLAPFLSP